MDECILGRSGKRRIVQCYISFEGQVLLRALGICVKVGALTWISLRSVAVLALKEDGTRVIEN